MHKEVDENIGLFWPGCATQCVLDKFAVLIDIGVKHEALIVAGVHPTRHAVQEVIAEEWTAQVLLAHIAPARIASHAQAAAAVRLALILRNFLGSDLDQLA